MRILLWDIDGTLLTGGGVAGQAFAAAFTATTGVAWTARHIDAAGRTDLAGRTDRWIAAASFDRHGVAFDDPTTFFARYAEEFRARTEALVDVGHALPGAAAVLATLAERPDVVQTLVTGNVRDVAHVKVAAFGLGEYLDLTVGAYGDDDHTDRAELVRLGRSRAEAVHGRCDDGDVVVVGDTPRDIAAARGAGVAAVGVATGGATAAELTAAGPDAMLPDLSDVDRAVATIAPRAR